MNKISVQRTGDSVQETRTMGIVFSVLYAVRCTLYARKFLGVFS